MRKLRDYLEASVHLIWAIDPEGRTAIVCRPGAPIRFLDEDGVLDGGDVLPGFTLPLRDVLL
jgi:hypothetical protein